MYSKKKPQTNVKASNRRAQQASSRKKHAPQNNGHHGALDRFKKAKMALEYDPRALEAFVSLKKLPEAFQTRFLQRLDQNPKADYQKIADEIRKDHQSWLYPSDDLKSPHF